MTPERLNRPADIGHWMRPPDPRLESLSEGTLVLFFTFRVPLSLWHEVGFIEREAALYNRLAEYFERVYLLTYGDEDDLAYTDYFADNVEIVPQSRVGNDHLYSLLLPLLHRSVFSEADVLKTNQMKGSWAAVLAKYLYGLPLIVRTGFVLTIFAEEQRRGRLKRAAFRAIEWVAYKAADAVMSPSPDAYEYVESTYAPPGEHLYVPNYVETDVFRPMDDVGADEGSICFVGRLGPQKNLLALVEALESSRYSLTLVGEGPLREEIRERAAEHGVDVTFLGNVPNHELPGILNGHELFVLPSLYEGMPKVLLEAMACGLPAVGTDVKGTREVIDDGSNGVLCGTGSESIRDAIDSVMGDDGLKERLGANARRTIEEEYSLESILEAELELYVDLLGE